MTKTELHRLAGAVSCLRPDWAPASLQTFLERHLAHRPLRDAAVALVAVALDPNTATPARVLEAGPWWQTSRSADVPADDNDCRTHPEAKLRIDLKTGDRTCAGCHVDGNEDPDATASFTRRPAPESARRALKPQADQHRQEAR
jgi:hypothetical protein